MSKPLFVAISDIHFTVNNLELATQALQAAINKAEELGIPLVIAGDLHDTKAIIRAEVMNRLLHIFSYKSSAVHTYILVGNHDLINEKGVDHGLNYLASESVYVVSSPAQLGMGRQDKIFAIPYQNTAEKFKSELHKIPKGSIVVCHQGVKTAEMGDYVQDKTSVESEALSGYTLISGHYHRHQTVGQLTYIGSPFTHTFGESNDGPKGFLVVNSDGTYTREILRLRKHIKLEQTLGQPSTLTTPIRPGDLLWLKVTGPQSQLDKLNKEEIGQQLLGHSNYKLDLIPLNNDTQSDEVGADLKLSSGDLLDKLIDSMPDSPEHLQYLKDLWKGLVS